MLNLAFKPESHELLYPGRDHYFFIKIGLYSGAFYLATLQNARKIGANLTVATALNTDE